MTQTQTLDEIKSRVRQYPERDWKTLIMDSLLPDDVKFDALQWLDKSPQTDAMAVDGDIDDIGAM